jgi:hypothetical protein
MTGSLVADNPRYAFDVAKGSGQERRGMPAVPARFH